MSASSTSSAKSSHQRQGSNKKERERGTLIDNQPNPQLILAIYQIICTIVATYIVHYSYRNDEHKEANANTDVIGEVDRIAWRAALGVASSILGVLYSDPFLYLVIFMLPLLISINAFQPTQSMLTLSPTQMQFASLPFILYLTTILLPPLRHILSTKFKSKTSTVTHLPILAPIPPLFLTLFGCSFIRHYNMDIDIGPQAFAFAPSIMAAVATMIIYVLYNRHKAHPSGNLTRGRSAMSIGTMTILISTLGILYATITDTDTDTTTNSALTMKIGKMMDEMIVYIIGALCGIMGIASFASVADAWYAIGTGQFQMISVDTAGIGFYFVLPLVILFQRFCREDKYGSYVDGFMDWCSGVIVNGYGYAGLSESYDPMIALEDEEDVGGIVGVYMAFIAFLLLTVCIGVGFVNGQCPMSGYLFGRVYTHGQLNTKLVAVSVDFKDVLKMDADAAAEDDDSSSWGMKDLKNMLLAWDVSTAKKDKDGLEIKAVLNVNVTASDVNEYPKKIEELVKAGYEIVIAPSSTLGGPKSISAANESILRLSHSPSWYHTGSSPAGSWPKYHSAALALGLRSAMWSNLICSAKDVDNLSREMEKHNGGSFIYIQPGSDASFSSLCKGVLDVLSAKQFVPGSLPLVAKEDPKMEL